MFERFTPRARKVMVSSQEEARRSGHDYIGTEHLLLGLLREDAGVAARVLVSLGVTLNEAREQVERLVHHKKGIAGQLQFTPRSKKVLEHSLSESLRLEHNYIGTEHILLGLVQEPSGAAVQVLSELDVGLDKVRREVVRVMSWDRERRSQETVATRTGRSPVTDARSTAFRARVEGLVVRVRCGVTDEERATPQPLQVDLDYLYEAVGKEDDLSKTLDYGVLIEDIAELLEREEFRLLETGAWMVGDHILNGFLLVREVTVCVTKLEVPIDREISGVSIEATFTR